MNVSDFYYELPPELIAADPLPERTMSRLMVLDRETGDISHRGFKDIADFLRPGDCLVLNDTRVLPARLCGEKEGSGGKMEFVLLKSLGGTELGVMVRPGEGRAPAPVSFSGREAPGGNPRNFGKRRPRGPFFL